MNAGVQIKLCDLLRTRAIPERLKGVFTTRRYTNPRLPLPFTLVQKIGLHCIIYTEVCPAVIENMNSL